MCVFIWMLPVQITSNMCLQALNTLALPAVAKQFLCFENEAQLPELQEKIQTSSKRWVLGGGSNMVMADTVDALLIHMQNKGIRLIAQQGDEVWVEAQAGEVWHDFVRYCLDQGWYGLENLALIPGTVGAAPVQNIGAYGIELQQVVHAVKVWDFLTAQYLWLDTADCQFAYRDSFFKRAPQGRYMIVAVQFKLVTAGAWTPILRYPDLQHHPLLQKTPITAQAVFQAVIAIRQQKLPDPAVLANAGSFFKNPIVTTAHYEQLLAQYPDLVAYSYQGQYKLAAGWLIDHAGWKGKRLGPVGMHKNQALVLVNYGGARAADVAALVQQVQQQVFELFQVQLEQEPIAVQ